MKKKTLLILLVIPFIIGLLSFVSVVILNNTVAADIVDIAFDYKQNVPFKVNTRTELTADAIVDEDLLLAPHSDELVWELENQDGSDEEYAVISQENDKYYLDAKKEGVVLITCRNKRGTRAKGFTGYIYDEAVILINRKYDDSKQNVDPNYYVGEFDLSYNELKMDGATTKHAKLELEPELIGVEGELFSKVLTPNISYENNVVSILDSGEAKIEFYTNTAPYLSEIFTFNIVEQGYNIYNYNDLLMATNFSSNSKNIVMQTSLGSLYDIYEREKAIDYSEANPHYIYKDIRLDENKNISLFGNFDFKQQKFSFDKEYVKVDSSYNTKFIKDYNSANGTNISNQIIAGINLKGDLYGNGFTINAHELAFPTHGKYGCDGHINPGQGDYFFGPLAFVTIGDLATLPMVKVFGQDNCLFYVNGDNITINDVHLRNANEIDDMYDLIYTGSVVEINGHNNTIKNSVIGNGRTAVRAFDANGLKIDNSILNNAGEFILKVGSNNVKTYDTSKEVSINFQGANYTAPFNEFFDINNEYSPVNTILSYALNSPKGSGDAIANENMNALNAIQEALDQVSDMKDENGVIYKDVIDVRNSYFSNSGLFSIAFETAFNGPYLLNGGAAFIKDLVEKLNTTIPNKLGGTSLPVLVNVDKNTKFYDWKSAESIDPSILIDENISTTIGHDIKLTMDDYFPMRKLLINEANKLGYVYHHENENYVNSKVAYYGGGLNLSKLNIVDSDFETMNMSETIDINIAEATIKGDIISEAYHGMILLLSRCVTSATGSHPFQFILNSKVNGEPIDFYSVPQIKDLMNNLK